VGNRRTNLGTAAACGLAAAVSLAVALALSGCADTSASESNSPTATATSVAPLPVKTAPRTVNIPTATKPKPTTTAKAKVAAKAQATAVVVAERQLAGLAVHAQASMAGYKRTEFGNGWIYSGGCNTRDRILARDLRDVTYRGDTCIVATGVLIDPYGGSVINFSKARDPSAVQIDHVVALGNAWTTGAASWTFDKRKQLANDPLELLAVDGPLNQAKGDDDASEWLPPRTAYRCAYVERQIAVKAQYGLWVTPAEKSAMRGVLADC
jgi:Protein of unknown function (DUF1524)